MPRSSQMRVNVTVSADGGTSRFWWLSFLVSSWWWWWWTQDSFLLTIFATEPSSSASKRRNSYWQTLTCGTFKSGVSCRGTRPADTLVNLSTSWVMRCAKPLLIFRAAAVALTVTRMIFHHNEFNFCSRLWCHSSVCLTWPGTFGCRTVISYFHFVSLFP